jgi:glycosyltransferase involved in cell wall biosynthesis
MAFGLVTFGCALFLLLCLYAATTLRGIRRLEPNEATPPVWPKLSVVVTALNEGTTIEAALKSLSSQTYPNLELIVVDDRSTDDTGAIIDRLAQADPRIRPVHISELPAGWLGKLHALKRGTEIARGDFTLYADADVHFGDRALERAIATCEANGLDHLAVLPDMVASSRALDAAFVAFGINFTMMTRPHAVGKPGSKAYAGVGAFNLVRRKVFDRTPGFEWLKMEVADDIGLGKMMIDAGSKSAWRIAGPYLKLTWYEDVPGLIRGLEKNVYGIFSHYRAWVFFAKLGAIALFFAGPVIALFAPPIPELRWFALAIFGAYWLVHVLAARAFERPLLSGVYAPFVGTAVLIIALARSALATWKNRGIIWRGTVYSVEELRAGQRLKL